MSDENDGIGRVGYMPPCPQQLLKVTKSSIRLHKRRVALLLTRLPGPHKIAPQDLVLTPRTPQVTAMWA
jgi:hypothetical protein